MIPGLPSRAAIWAAAVALVSGALAWLRFDAARDARRTLETEATEKDLTDAQTIRDRVSDDRADPDRLRPFEDAGWRD